MALVQARKAQDFHHSIGVNTSLHYPQYSDYEGVKAALDNIGIKYIRGGSLGKTAAYQDLYNTLGIKVMFCPSSWIHGFVPNTSYRTTGQDGPSDTQRPAKTLIVPHLINLGACLHSVEMINEPDLFYPNYAWSEADPTPLSGDKTSPYYWVKFLDKWVRDCHTALKANPATANLTIVGPAPGTLYNYSNRNPMMDMSAYVNKKNGHYYSSDTNSFQNAGAYAGLPNYYGQGGFPGNATGRLLSISDYSDNNLGKGESGNSALYRLCSEKPYGSDKKLVLSECGVHTSYDSNGVTYTTHGKIIPRTYVEHFRLEIEQTYIYELVNRGSGTERTRAKEDSFGLLEKDLTYKPGAIQLKALIDTIRETTPDTRTAVGSLDYSLNLTMPTGYDRENYVKQVLLQKQNGDFVLLVYHNVAIMDTRQIKPPLLMSHPNVSAVLTLPRHYSIKKTTLRTDGVEPTAIVSPYTKDYSFEITDTVTVLELTATNVPLTSENINCTSGSTSLGSDSAIIKNIGTDIWGNSDSFTFASRSSDAANGVIESKCSKPSSADTWTKAGVMYREDNTPGSQYYALVLRPNGSIYEQFRLTTGAGTSSALVANTNPTSGAYFRINKVGNTYQGQYKLNESDAWITRPLVTVVLGDTPMSGIYLCSHSAAEAVCSFSGVKLD